jgi:hypothetical protein
MEKKFCWEESDYSIFSIFNSLISCEFSQIKQQTGKLFPNLVSFNVLIKAESFPLLTPENILLGILE